MSVATCALDLLEELHEAPHPLEALGRCLPQALLDLARVDARRQATGPLDAPVITTTLRAAVVSFRM
ncbi:MAG: hypothetical protein E6J77_09140, partial [Deltaproteobacteria bacterium]